MAVPSGPVAGSTEVESVLFDFVDAYDRAYEEAAAAVGLSAAHACVLGRLAEDRGMGSLAQELGCDASNVTQIVARLEAKGLVERRPDPADRRGRLITRTAEGTATNARLEQAFGFARNAVAGLTTAEQNQLAALLRKSLGR